MVIGVGNAAGFKAVLIAIKDTWAAIAAWRWQLALGDVSPKGSQDQWIEMLGSAILTGIDTPDAICLYS